MIDKFVEIRSMICVAVFLISILPSTTYANELSPEQLSSIDAIAERIQTEAQFPGLTVIVNIEGQNVYAKAFGVVDLENQIPAELDSVYAIGSITKSYTALSILQLVESGEIALDDKVSAILPDYQGPGSEVTVAQLLTHTSGIPNYLHEIPAVRGTFTRRSSTRQQMQSYFENEPLLFEPGTRWSYSNSGYYLLGIIVEKIGGKSYYDYLRENVFVPLDLNSTYSGDDSEIVPHRARGYELQDGTIINAPPWHYLVPFSAGSLLSTAADVASYRRAVFRSDKVSPGLRDLLAQTSTLVDGTRIQYTLGGLVSSSFHGHQKYSHSGEIYGYFSDHAYYPESDLTIVVLTNRRGASPTPVTLERKIARVVLNILQADTKDLSLETDELMRYSGDFEVGPVLFGPPTYGFVAHDGHLLLKFGGTNSGASEVPLLAQGSGLFVMENNDEWFFQFVGKGNVAASFEMTARDATVIGHRVN